MVEMQDVEMCVYVNLHTYICWEERGVVVMSLSATLLQLSSQNDVAKTSAFANNIFDMYVTWMLNSENDQWYQLGSSGYFGMLSFCSFLSFRVSQRLEDITTTGMKAAV